MRIFILHNKLKAGSYTDALFKLLIQFLKKHEFTLIDFDDSKDLKKVNFSDKKLAVVFHSGKKEMSFFSKLSLQTFLKKNGFDRLVQVTDTKPISSKLYQLIVSNDSKKLVENSTISFAVCSTAEKQKLTEQNEAAADFIKVIPLAAEDDYQPITWSEQQALKIEHTQGREYFLVTAKGKTIQSFTELLKAFSTFKKWQHSSMKLVVAGKLSFTETDDWKEKISTYKFRGDVALLNDLTTAEKVQILAGAYAFIHTPITDNDILPVLQAMKCETPCLSFTTNSFEEYAGEAAIIIEPNNYDMLAEKMILIYKDEALRSRLIAKGKEASEHYTKEKVFALLAEALSPSLH